MAVLLFEYRYFVNHVASRNIAAIALTFLVVEITLMLSYAATERGLEGRHHVSSTPTAIQPHAFDRHGPDGRRQRASPRSSNVTARCRKILRDALVGLSYGLAIGCMLLGVWRIGQSPEGIEQALPTETAR